MSTSLECKLQTSPLQSAVQLLDGWLLLSTLGQNSARFWWSACDIFIFCFYKWYNFWCKWCVMWCPVKIRGLNVMEEDPKGGGGFQWLENRAEKCWIISSKLNGGKEHHPPQWIRLVITQVLKNELSSDSFPFCAFGSQAVCIWLQWHFL